MKRNCFKGCFCANIIKCPSQKFLLGISHIRFRKWARLFKQAGDPRQNSSGMTALFMPPHLPSGHPLPQGARETTGGFTLIELLVVVLIIGILAAVAVPQYQKAVWRSRNTQLKTLVTSIAKAQEAYYLANGKYAESLNQLDVDLPAWSSSKTSGATCPFDTAEEDDSVRYTENFLIGIGEIGIIKGVWLSGPYQCGGFQWSFTNKRLICSERANIISPAGKFCEKLENAVYSSQPSTWRYYSL